LHRGAPVLPIDMDVARFNPDGGPLEARIVCGFAQPGSYELRLFAAGSNVLVPWPPLGEPKPTGNFLNPDDDRYALPGLARENDGRLLECFASVEIAPPLNAFSLALEVFQDGEQIGRDVKEGTGGDFATVVADLFVELRAEG
jgi:hypothetical protein